MVDVVLSDILAAADIYHTLAAENSFINPTLIIMPPSGSGVKSGRRLVL